MSELNQDRKILFFMHDKLKIAKFSI